MMKRSTISLLGLMMPMSTLATESQQDSVSLSPLLMYVADRNGAEMVAPKVQAIMDSTPIDKIVMDEFDRTLLDATYTRSRWIPAIS